MLERLRRWRRERRERERRVGVAIDCAVREFRRTYTNEPMGAHVLRLDAARTLVRVMYVTTHVPPGRAWYAVSTDGSSVRELSFEEVAEFEVPWR
jgi:hypothetical protein